MFIQTFTDPQGVLHTNALFKVKTAHSNVTTREDMTIDEQDWATYSNGNSVSSSVTYQMFFWIDQAAYDEGMLPYLLYTAAGRAPGSYSFAVPAEYAGFTLEEMCDAHCAAEVIPNILEV